MRRILLLATLAFAVGLMPRAAFAAANTSHETMIGGASTGETEICDVAYELTLAYNGVIQSTEAPGGSVKTHVTVAGALVAEPVSGDGPTYTGRYTESFGYRQMLKNGSFTWVIGVIAFGSDGSRLRLTSLIHINQSASGLEFSFEKVSCSA